VQCLERPRSEQVLLQGPDEAFGDAIARGLAHEGTRSFGAQTFDLILEIVRYVIGAMIVTQLQPHTTPGATEPKDRRTASIAPDEGLSDRGDG
jgi:hypothetical protein